jgi:DTW domain-containing protein
MRKRMSNISTYINSVRELRKQQLPLSTREFKARGASLKRCDECQLGESKCICGLVSPVNMDIGVCMVMYHAEYFKPSNTGQLICEIVKDNFAFRWQRTECEPKLLELLSDPTWYPVIIFPHDNVETSRQLQALPNKAQRNNKRPLFIFLDGTWRQAKKMFIKSPYLHSFPVLQLNDVTKGDYQLREAVHEHHLSTVEVAVELFKQNDEANAGEQLEQLFHRFRTGYKHFKR